MDILQKTFNEAVEELIKSASSEEELRKLAGALPGQIEGVVGELPDQILSSIKAVAEQGLEERRAMHAEFVDNGDVLK